jgi:hypothetical protein
MMHDGGWLFGMGLYWQLPILILAIVIVAWLFARRRSANGS